MVKVGDWLPAGAIGNARANHVLSPFTFSSEAGVDIRGVMVDRGTVTRTLTNQGDIVNLSAGYYTGGSIKTNITNLSASNIKKGVKVGGIEGSYEGEFNALYREYRDVKVTQPEWAINEIYIGTNSPKFINIYYQKWSQYYEYSIKPSGEVIFIYIDIFKGTINKVAEFSIENNKLKWKMSGHSEAVVDYNVVY